MCFIGIYLYCLNRFVKFITTNAYVQVALKSDNFCTAAWNAFILILRNAAKFGFVSLIGTVFMLLGKALICSIPATIGFIFCAYVPYI